MIEGRHCAQDEEISDDMVVDDNLVVDGPAVLVQMSLFRASLQFPNLPISDDRFFPPCAWASWVSTEKFGHVVTSRTILVAVSQREICEKDRRKMPEVLHVSGMCLQLYRQSHRPCTSIAQSIAYLAELAEHLDLVQPALIQIQPQPDPGTFVSAPAASAAVHN